MNFKGSVYIDSDWKIPTEQMIRSKFYNPKFWEVVDPSLMFRFRADGIWSSMIVHAFMLENNRKFNLKLTDVQFTNGQRKNIGYYSYNGTENNTICSINPGGERFAIYGKYLVSREKALDAILYYIEHGVKSPNLDWVEGTSIDKPEEG